MARPYGKASWRPAGGGFEITLDDQPVRTPAKAPLVVPSEGLARAIAGEWAAQGDKVKPATMPLSRRANSAIDHIASHLDETRAGLAAYGETDLLCYRAEAGSSLAARQAAAWDPLLDWAAREYGARLKVTAGITPVAQDGQALVALARGLEGAGAFALAGLHGVVTIAGSLIVGLAVAARRLGPEEAWAAGRIDDEHQAEKWGIVEEAAEHRDARHKDMISAAEFLLLSPWTENKG